MLWALRGALYVQVLLGLGRYVGLVLDRRIWDIHLLLGIVIAVLALVALRPLPEQVTAPDKVRRFARFVALIPLALGLAMRFGGLTGMAFILLHMALGFITLGLVEVAAARERRVRRDDRDN